MGAGMYKYIVVIIILLLVGCVSLPSSEQENILFSNNGIIINTFSSDLLEVREDDAEFTISMEIENVGERTAKNIVVELFGINWPVKWKNNMGIYSSDDFRKQIPSMLPPDIQTKETGEFQLLEWTICVPDLPEGTKKSIEVIGRVTYDYSTSSTADIHAITRNEFTRRKQINAPVYSSIDITNSFGPIQVTIDGESPIIIETRRAQMSEDERYEIVSYRITFTNTGSGIPITDGIDGKITGSIRIEGPDVELYDCFEKTDKTESFIEVRLRRGESITKACSIKIDRKQWKEKNIPEDIIRFILDLDYTYYVQKPLTITFYGQEFEPPVTDRCIKPGIGEAGLEETPYDVEEEHGTIVV